MAPDVNLAGKNILVTGGSMGLGFATAETCLRAGARVVICARDPAAVEGAYKKLQTIAGAENVRALPADVVRGEDIEKALDFLEAEFGPLTSLIHAAAIQGPIGDILSVDPGLWMETVSVNLFGSFLTARQSCLRMKRAGGRIVLFSGGGAATPSPAFTAYACSKAAVVRFAETVALEMARYSIEINCLAPGLVATRMLEGAKVAGHVPKSEPVPASLGAQVAAFLVSDRARGITGKLVAAPHDGWADWPDRLRELKDSDLFTLRRIVPRDRGMDWQ